MNNFTFYAKRCIPDYQKIKQLPEANQEEILKSRIINARSMFRNCSSLERLDTEGWDTSSCNNMYEMFDSCVCLKQLNLEFDTSNVIDMGSMFYWLADIETIDVSCFDTSSVRSMNAMFCSCMNLKKLDLSEFHTENVTDMDFMFAYDARLRFLGLNSFKPRNLRSCWNMFNDCQNIREIRIPQISFYHVINMENMFNHCYLLKQIDGVIDMSSCRRYDNMFFGCGQLKDVRIKNPPADFEQKTGLHHLQYEVVL